MGETVRTTCPYCGVGCGILAGVAQDGAVVIKGDPSHPANSGRLCSKGSALGETVSLEGRLFFPEVSGRRTGWDEALDLVASKFTDSIREHGVDSVAFYVSGQMLTEDYYVANKLMKGFIGSANIDTNSRLCMASSVAGHRRAFGSDTVPGNYDDLELADLVVLTGSNLAWCHPVLYQRLAEAKEKRPEMRIVLIDPRRTMTADIADLHLAIRPDGDVALFNGLLSHLVENGAIDETYVRNFTNGFTEAVAAVSGLGAVGVAKRAGVPVDQLAEFYRLFAVTEKTVTVYSQGVNQSCAGTDKVNAIINCHLATGRIGKPGMGPFSVTGQPNAMGGREVGGLANMLAAHMEIENASHRELVQRFWGSPAVAAKHGLKAVDMFRAVADGRIKALWIIATNPVDSLPDADFVEAAIKACPFVVVSDVLAETDTVRHAHVKLPSAAWGEKDGTVTNSERRISRQRAFLPLPGEAMPDWWQLAEIGRRMGYGESFAYSGPASIFAEHAALSGFENDGERDFDISAHAVTGEDDYRRMDPFQWPQPAGNDARDMRFFAAGGFFTPDNKGRFVPVCEAEQAPSDLRYPMTLNTGRVRDHWHTMTRTGRSARLSAHIAEPFAEIHPSDATSLGIGDADIVRVESAHGHVLVRALLSKRQRRGSVFVPLHWTDQYTARGRVDALVAPVTDPFSGQPALKNVPVAVSRFEASHYGFAVTTGKPHTRGLDYWALARCGGGWRLEFAVARRIREFEEFGEIVTGCVVGDAEALAYLDAERGDYRSASFDGSRLRGAFFISPGPVAVSRGWAVGQLTADHPDRHARFRVIAGRGGADKPDTGAIVCSCFSVGVNDIARAARAGCGSVAAIGTALSAGTNCGSCRAEIQGIIDEHQVIAAE